MQCSTSDIHHTTLHLNAFRGEPAITEFDWPFTPTHNSSPRFSTLVGSDLHDLLQPLHPGHGEITPLRVYTPRLNASAIQRHQSIQRHQRHRPMRTRFRYGSPTPG